MPILIAPRTDLVKLAQAVALRNPITAVGAVVLDGDESVRADLVGAGVGALHGPGAVGDEVCFGAEGADGGGGEGAGALGFGAAEGFVGLGGEGEGGEGCEEEGEGWQLHGGGGGRGFFFLGSIWRGLGFGLEGWFGWRCLTRCCVYERGVWVI